MLVCEEELEAEGTLKVGIIGLPQVGKTSVFRLLTGNGAAAKGRAGIGVASIPDDRIDLLSAMYRTKKSTYATLTCVLSWGGSTPLSQWHPGRGCFDPGSGRDRLGGPS